MGMGEDELLLPRRAESTDAGSSGSGGRQRRQQPGVRKLLQPLAMALGIFGVSAGAARYLFPREKIQQEQQLLRSATPDVLVGDTYKDTAACSTSTKIVMQGADLTSYFSLEPGAAPVFGVEEHEAVYNGYKFWFVSEENKAKFEADPVAYMPVWGGFCSWGIAEEDWWTKDNLGPEADPAIWFLSDEGNLHFFRSPTPMAYFMKDVLAYTQAGDEVWLGWWNGAEPGAALLGEYSPLDTDCFCSAETCVD